MEDLHEPPASQDSEMSRQMRDHLWRQTLWSYHSQCLVDCVQCFAILSLEHGETHLYHFTISTTLVAGSDACCLSLNINKSTYLVIRGSCAPSAFSEKAWDRSLLMRRWSESFAVVWELVSRSMEESWGKWAIKRTILGAPFGCSLPLWSFGKLLCPLGCLWP